MAITQCSKCGKVISTEFPVHDCKPTPNFLRARKERAAKAKKAKPKKPRKPRMTAADRIDAWIEKDETNQQAIDSLVHDQASEEASSVNNGGADAQLKFLRRQGMSASEVLEELGVP